MGPAKYRFSVLRAGSAAVETGKIRPKSGSSPEPALSYDQRTEQKKDHGISFYSFKLTARDAECVDVSRLLNYCNKNHYSGNRIYNRKYRGIRTYSCFCSELLLVRAIIYITHTLFISDAKELTDDPEMLILIAPESGAL